MNRLTKGLMGLTLMAGAALAPMKEARADTNAVVNMTNNLELTWNWGTQHLYQASASAGGTVTGDTNNWYDAGTTVTSTAVPDTNRMFVCWTNVPGGTNGSNPLSFALNSAYTNVQALFDWTNRNLTVNSAYGTPTPGSGTWKHGTVVTQNIESVVNGPAGTRYRVKNYTLAPKP